MQQGHVLSCKPVARQVVLSCCMSQDPTFSLAALSGRPESSARRSCVLLPCMRTFCWLEQCAGMTWGQHQLEHLAQGCR